MTVLCAVVAGCLALSACSGSSDSGGGSSSGKIHGIPAYATKTSVHGQEAFASYWVSAVNRATSTGNTKPMRALAAKSCTTCADFANTLEQIYAHGGHVETKGWRVASVVPIAKQPKNNPGVQLNLKVTPQVVYKTKGAKPRKYKGGKESFRFFMTRQDNRWLVQRLDV